MIMTEYDKLINEHFDISDSLTRRCIIAMKEDAQQSQLLGALSSALYDKVVNNVDKIDFGSIPRSRGDITKIDGYDNTMECLNIMRKLILEYKEDPHVVDVVLTAVQNIKERKALFMKAFTLGIELPIVLYNLIVLSIEQSVSFLISVCIQYVKDPETKSIDVALDKAAYYNVKDNVIYEQLEKFNESCANGDVDKVFEAVMKSKNKVAESFMDDYLPVPADNDEVLPAQDSDDTVVQPKDVPVDPTAEPVHEEEPSDDLAEIEAPEDEDSDGQEPDVPAPQPVLVPDTDDSVSGEDDYKDQIPDYNIMPGNDIAGPSDKLVNANEDLALALTIATGIIGGGFIIYKTILKVIIPMMRVLTYNLISSRMKISDSLAVQAQFIELNALKLQNSTIDDDGLDEASRRRIVDKQMKIAAKMKTASNKWAIDSKTSSKKAKEMIEDEKKKFKIEEFKDQVPADVYNKSVLF
jgi:hypothetical protein